MPEREPLPPDPESLEKWQQMPSTTPSKQAMPPAAGGLRLWPWQSKLLIALLVLIILAALLQQGRPM